MIARGNPGRFEQAGCCVDLLGNDPDELVRNLQDRFPKAELIGADRQYESLVARVIGFIEAPGSALIYLSMYVARLSSSGFGEPCRKSLSAGPYPTPRSLAVSARPRRSGPWRALARPITWRSPFHVIAW